MGGDSAVSIEGGWLHSSSSAKVWRSGQWLLGFAGGAADYSALRALELPAAPSAELELYVHSEITAAVRQALERGGVAEADYELLVGVSGELFVCSDGGADRVRGTYAAVGSGAPVALGSLHTSAGSPAEARVRWALEAAETHCDGVRRPWRILTA